MPQTLITFTRSSFFPGCGTDVVDFYDETGTYLGQQSTVYSSTDGVARGEFTHRYFVNSAATESYTGYVAYDGLSVTEAVGGSTSSSADSLSVTPLALSAGAAAEAVVTLPPVTIGASNLKAALPVTGMVAVFPGPGETAVCRPLRALPPPTIDPELAR